jgi:hypothetical protein
VASGKQLIRDAADPCCVLARTVIGAGADERCRRSGEDHDQER